MSTSSYAIVSLLEKMQSPDSDYRFMALSDLSNELPKTTFTLDPSSESRLIAAITGLLQDKNGEVVNQYE